MKQNQKLKIEWQGNSWVVKDPLSPKTAGIKIDGAVVNVTARGERFVEGYIVAVHGLDLGVAQHLDPSQLAALGVGAHLRAHAVAETRWAAQTRRSFGKVSLMPGGRISGGRA